MTACSFDFVFPGFIDDGVCGITIGESKGSPIVVICSQKINYHGTSVTNALESIAFKLVDDALEGHLSKVCSAPLLKKLRDIWTKLEEAGPHALSSFYAQGVVTWIEHYPPNAGLTPEHTFSEVWFDEDDNPTWLSSKSADSAKTAFGAEVVQAAISFADRELVHGN